MKQTIAIAAIIVLIAVQITAAQSPAVKLSTEEKKVAFAAKNLLNGLNSNNTGVVESAMRLTAQLTMRYPATDVNNLVDAINTIWLTHPNGSTRYKAYIALSICQNPEWYAGETAIVTANEETFFRAASVRLQAQLLSVNE
jgi:hypothetical protein